MFLIARHLNIYCFFNINVLLKKMLSKMYRLTVNVLKCECYYPVYETRGPAIIPKAKHYF